MIKFNNKLQLDFIDCNSEENEILTLYWNCDEKGNFSATIREIYYQYKIKQNDLYKLVTRKSVLTWLFDACNCGNEVTYKISNRNNLTACLKDQGTVERVWTSSVKAHFRKCEICREKQSQYELKIKERKQKKTTGWILKPKSFDWRDEIISRDESIDFLEIIRKLLPTEVKLLYQIYDKGDFKLINNSNEIFPVRTGEYYRAVWRTIYKLERIGLIELLKHKNGSFVYDMIFFDKVRETLEHASNEFDIYVEQTEIELSLLRILEGHKVKYLTVFEPETDLVLKAGYTYEFIAHYTSDKNILLKVYNLSQPRQINKNTTILDPDITDSDSCPF